MLLSLPKPIAAYFAADTADGAAVAQCFTFDAVVIDEKRTHRGREAIARWKTEASAKFDYVSEPVALDDQGDRTIVTARLTGNFPGSPLNLRFAFTLAGDAIARLEIAP
ncbi:nuclear transport factor 2 family protein [Zavarzinia compransoris]|uniref:nuclear transport factor 2 family protein n=1 Tax=Zavarzinia marina TaxID=2911065 RepID=UPI001F16872F|nr:nuclear transport factor 2 family protein [Zavarzinia marina]MCF4164310.1 nuclear transport factor 2 family protein [Zavarzinia marina]